MFGDSIINNEDNNYIRENKKIINFIKYNYNNTNNEEIHSEINDIVDNFNNNTCSFGYNQLIKKNILGITTTVNKSVIDLSYLIPNLFRKCYYKDKIEFPNVCPLYISQSFVRNYFPYLLEEELIKSYLYFNFPASYINKDKIDENIKRIKNIENYIKTNTIINYGQDTTALQLLDIIYSDNSIIKNLFKFQNYIGLSNFAENEEKIINSFRIEWDITISCFSYTNNPNDSYMFLNNTNESNNPESIIDPSTANNIHDIYLSGLNNFTAPNQVNDDGIVILFYENIYTVLDYTTEVIRDILFQLDCLKLNKVYCKKPYMLDLNIPILLKLYNIFYNNQIYSLSRDVPNQSAISVIPSSITLEEYINSFINIMSKTYGKTITYLKNIIINSKLMGFVFYLNLPAEDMTNNVNSIDTTTYSYYYIDILNPSPITYYNYVLRIPAFNNITYDSVEYFIMQFNNGFTNTNGVWTGYIKNNNISYTNYIKYPKSALYPNFGIDSTAFDGYLYTYFDSSYKLISKVFLTLCYGRYTDTSYALPLALEITTNL
jgi:hypothetical protein